MWSLQLYGKVENHKVNKAIRSSEKEDEGYHCSCAILCL